MKFYFKGCRKGKNMGTKKSNAENEKNTMKITVVDSVKGGCGKTSISLKYAIQCSLNDEKVCVIDMDLLGSSIESFIIGKSFVDNRNFFSSEYGKVSIEGTSKEKYESDVELLYSFQVESPPARHYINDMFNNTSFDRSFLTEMSIINIKNNESEDNGENNKKEKRISIAACNPSQNEKNRFKPSREMHYIEQIDYEYFALEIEKMFEALDKMGFDHIIIDMPPNSDAYTDMIFSILLKSDYKKIAARSVIKKTGELQKIDNPINTKYDIEIFIVNSFDRAHFEANIEWVKYEIENGDMKQIRFNDARLCFIFNDIENYNFFGIDPRANIDKANEMRHEIIDKNIRIDDVFLYKYDQANARTSILRSGVYFGIFKHEKVTDKAEMPMETNLEEGVINE